MHGKSLTTAVLNSWLYHTHACSSMGSPPNPETAAISPAHDSNFAHLPLQTGERFML
jgi:hypothetical protein